MKRFWIIQAVLLLSLLSTDCRNTVSVELGKLTLHIDWAELDQNQTQSTLKPVIGKELENKSRVQKTLTQPDTLPEISKVRITLEPGPVVFEFPEIWTSYSIQAELGIYHVLVEALDAQGRAVFSADTSKILIKPPNQIQISLRIVPNYPTTAPEFVGVKTMNLINRGDYCLNWTCASRADSFQLEENTSLSFASSTLLYTGPDTCYEISGKPDGTYYYRVRGCNFLSASPWSAIVGFQVNIAETLMLLSTSLSAGFVGIPYQSRICFQGGTAPFDWELVDSSLPSGLTAAMSDSCMVISGVPAVQGAFPLTLNITDSGNPQQSVTFQGTILISPPNIEILNVTLADARVGKDYSECVQLPDTLDGYQWEFFNNPDWLQIHRNGNICFTGMPEGEGEYSWTALGAHPGTPEKQIQIHFALKVEAALEDLSISPSTLSDGFLNQSYQTGICASGGMAPYQYAIVQGVLPAGLNGASAACLEISGTPAESGIFQFTVEATDNQTPPDTVQKAFMLEIKETVEPLEIVTPTLADGQLESFYEQPVCASGGIPPYTWQITEGTLPDGLALTAGGNDTCVTLSGTPEAQGTFTFTLEVNDSADPQQTVSLGFSLTIHPTVLSIVTDLLPDGTIDSLYSQSVCAEKGTPPYQWEITDGALPNGLNAAGKDACFDITGTPTETGEFSFTLQVSDNGAPQQTASRAFSIAIHPSELTIVTDSLPDGTVGGSYHQTVCAENGTSPFQWEITDGTLPTGLNAVGNVGCFDITGTPTEAGEFSFTVQVTDNSAPVQVQTRSYKITIQPPSLYITTAKLPNGNETNYYFTNINAQGGSENWTWSYSGKLPSGLGFLKEGDHAVIRGTPTQSGTYAFTVYVCDNIYTGLCDTAQFSIKINVAPLKISTSSTLPYGLRGNPYTEEISATGGSNDYTWSLTGGSLPPGLGYSWSAGQPLSLTGTPASAGTFVFTFQVTDNVHPELSETKQFSLRIMFPFFIGTNSPLPDGEVGKPYGKNISAWGGSGSYTWSKTGGSLPAGITLSNTPNDSNYVSGTPSEPGTFSFTVRATDTMYPELTDDKTYSLSINPGFFIVQESLPNANLAITYHESIWTSTGHYPIYFSIISGSLPPGMELHQFVFDCAEFIGTPTALGTYDFTVKAIDSSDPQKETTKSFSITVYPEPVEITTSSPLPDAVLGAPYGYETDINVSGGTGNYTCSIISGSLPAGFTFTDQNVKASIYGDLTESGTFIFTVRVTDDFYPALSDTKEFSLTVNGLEITTSSLPDGTIGMYYDKYVDATGGSGDYSWSVISGSLPSGITLLPFYLEGLSIRGTPTVTGTFTFTIKVEDNVYSGEIDTKQFSLTINP